MKKSSLIQRILKQISSQPQIWNPNILIDVSRDETFFQASASENKNDKYRDRKNIGDKKDAFKSIKYNNRTTSPVEETKNTIFLQKRL